jgi:ADP-ribose pyrophosphatase
MALSELWIRITKKFTTYRRRYQVNEYSGKYVNVVIRNNYEVVERKNSTGIVGIIALDKEDILLVEQWREPVLQNCIELPAGIIGDTDSAESLLAGANRELHEEVGYRANKMTIIGEFPLTPGMTNEVMTLILATDLVKVGPGGGVENENITIHRFNPMLSLMKLMDMRYVGDGTMRYIDAKVLSGVHVAQLYLNNRTLFLGETFDTSTW